MDDRKRKNFEIHRYGRRLFHAGGAGLWLAGTLIAGHPTWAQNLYQPPTQPQQFSPNPYLPNQHTPQYNCLPGQNLQQYFWGNDSGGGNYSGTTVNMQPSAQPPQTQGTAMQQYGSPTFMPVNQWFFQYDQIRHNAQMSPAEKQQADQLMSKGLSILVPGSEKQATKTLLGSLAIRYQRACEQLRNLQQIPQTNCLQHYYFQYFTNAGQLFFDYVRVQDNVFVADATTGKPLAAGLLQRKQMLEALERQCKQLDFETRNQLQIAPYAW